LLNVFDKDLSNSLNLSDSFSIMCFQCGASAKLVRLVPDPPDFAPPCHATEARRERGAIFRAFPPVSDRRDV
jgi:hypothetical protein